MTDSVLEKIKSFSADQYGNENRLNARVQIYNHAENSDDFHRWIFDKLDFRGVRDVLDLGCGNGLIWRKNIEHIPENVHFTLSDISEGMVDSAAQELKTDGRFEFFVTDACETPFPGNHFQMVIANHMVYYFGDKNQVFKEITRLLADNGFAYASTLSTDNFLELFYIADDFDRRLVINRDDIVENFSLENGEDILSGYFDVADRFIYRNDVVNGDADSLILYLASCFESEQLNVLVDTYDDFKSYLESVIAKKGKLRITNKAVLFRFRKKL